MERLRVRRLCHAAIDVGASLGDDKNAQVNTLIEGKDLYRTT